jgi:hypothetical protein
VGMLAEKVEQAASSRHSPTAMSGWIVPVTLAAAETYGLYTVAEPAHLTAAERIPAYFGNVEWWCPISATVAYLAFCYFGSKAMRARGKPLDESFMKRCMMVYNFYQTFFNVACIVLCLRAHRQQGMSVWGNYIIILLGGVANRAGGVYGSLDECGGGRRSPHERGWHQRHGCGRLLVRRGCFGARRVDRELKGFGRRWCERAVKAVRREYG